MHAASSWPCDSLPLVLIIFCVYAMDADDSTIGLSLLCTKIHLLCFWAFPLFSVCYVHFYDFLVCIMVTIYVWNFYIFAESGHDFK